MIFTETPLKGAFIVDPEKRKDERGFFARTFCANEFAAHGLKTLFVQGNMSRSVNKHTLRGMHFQTGGAEEAKLVRCTRGALYDVILDLRADSPTFGQHFSVELSEANGRQLYIPEGFAHGFCTLEDSTEIAYLVSAFYAPGKESGIRWNDPGFNIYWPSEQMEMSEKDAGYPDYTFS
jgi:dTDP-4-dehydrorhamnose 3,5-epimerase